MLRSLEGLQFVESDADGLKIQVGTQGEMIEMSFDLQALELEESIKSSEDMIVLGHDTTDRSFAQSGILFERFVEDFYRPSFLIGR